MAKKMPETPMLDQLESGPWPSFVTNLKRLAQTDDKQYADRMKDLLGQLEYSYKNIKGYWKGGTVGVRGYGGGVIPRFSEVADKFPLSAEFHTLRIMPSPGYHYSTEALRKLCDVWEEHGTGLIALHGQSGDIMMQGCSTEQVQKAFDALNEYGFDMGGAGPCLRSSQACVGAARCEFSCYDEGRALRTIINNQIDDLHRPSLPYKFKFKFSGCPNDCADAIHRSDGAVIGTWKDDIRVNQQEFKKYVAERGRKDIIDNVITRCPTHAMSLNDDDTVEVHNKSCVRCMHCINVLPKALRPGKVKGCAILLGGKHTLQIGDLMGVPVVPFMRLETDEDYEKLKEFASRIIEFFAENALEHERFGEMLERIGVANVVEGLGLEVDPNMVVSPRSNPYVRMDDWDDQAAKWNQRKVVAAE